MMFTSQTAMPSSSMPARNAMTPATHSSSAIRWVKLLRNVTATGVLPSSSIRFLPYVASRISACEPDSPSASVCMARYTLSTGIRLISSIE